ncbi:UDP-N-acetylmuramate dehydrogenase [Psychroflexus salarius]|uniref:UDP-N-acetylenolpyruvoylglucosamine reductase n=1 Tax=Psychroflexus salarius TaxID=1155689 RepID=A0A1M4XX93_9FLAO|nr:UDP-N-acetylmuramate dehydrogenase [Psychroflexus salarius]
MINIKKDFSLKTLNTFGIDVKAKQFISVTKQAELLEILRRFYASELFILGGGSNMLLTKDINKTVVHVNLKGIETVQEDENHIWLNVQAGENWHEFVLYCIENNYGGLENLSLIPGNVGTSPIQNIGAYGVELKDNFEFCEAINVQTLNTVKFNKADCEFGYRQSVFKNKYKSQFIITNVCFKLTKRKHNLHLDYGAIKTVLDQKNIKNPSIKDISDVVIAIRSSKLPNPKELGNSGSFFKNPIISAQHFEQLQQKFDLKYYVLASGDFKIPAGWLIDQCQLKGYRQGDAAVHKQQALVLVNHGNASGHDILNLAKYIQAQVFNTFNIKLEPEVNIY